jgi:hypothetical protein
MNERVVRMALMVGLFLLGGLILLRLAQRG